MSESDKITWCSIEGKGNPTIACYSVRQTTWLNRSLWPKSALHITDANLFSMDFFWTLTIFKENSTVLFYVPYSGLVLDFANIFSQTVFCQWNLDCQDFGYKLCRYLSFYYKIKIDNCTLFSIDLIRSDLFLRAIITLPKFFFSKKFVPADLTSILL